ncbi:MAG: peptidoglycan DD-metalloendopeptidase family protein [Parvularculaceae bacterium]|nr:peptidoglycan DD-metalloendopeptidase family protein [Parvularculaceae bacterium]
MKSKRMPTVLAAAAALSPSVAFGQIYDLPFLADDLNPGERASTFDHAETPSQKFGYDISMVRLTDAKKWSSLIAGASEDPDSPKNANRVIYGKPIYAMRDGVVVACWRNAPENPRPFISGEDETKQLWLHAMRRSGRIGGGGNAVFVVHDDGTMALYAHTQPGSVPSSLCPHDEVLLPVVQGTPPENEFGIDMRVDVPAAQRKRVKAGQFLGRVGNSGESKGPHLHIHVQKKGPTFATNNDDWVGVPIVFRRGLAQPRVSKDVDINQWTSFSGKIIPKGDTIFWPPTRLNDEFARHGFEAASMQRTWTHLANSGFMPVVIDCYAVGGDVKYNMIWRPADAAWTGFFGLPSGDVQAKADAAKTDGLAPVFVESCSSRNGPRYAAIFKKTAGSYVLRHSLSTSEHDAELDKAKAAGLSPVNVSVVSVGGQRRYAVLYRKQSLGGWTLKSQIPLNGYQAAVTEQVEGGRYPAYISVYTHDGKRWVSAVFAQAPNPDWTARHDMTATAYQSEYEAARKRGYLTRTIAGYDGADDHRFAATWRR